MTAQSPSPAASPIDRLLHAKESLPPEVRAAVLDMGDAAVAPLVAILGDDAHCDVDAPGAGFAPVHAVELLTTLKAPSGIAPMLALLADTTPDDIVHDLIVRRLPELGAPVLEPVLAQLAATEGADARAPLFAIASRLGIKDERIFDALASLYDSDPVLGSLYFADYGDARALPRVRAQIMEYAPDLDAEHAQVDLRDLVHAFESLGGIVDLEMRIRMEAIALLRKEHAAAKRTGSAKVGRNDPCPCGSGKKFKKCCIDGPSNTGTPSP